MNKKLNRRKQGRHMKGAGGPSPQGKRKKEKKEKREKKEKKRKKEKREL